MDYTAIFSTKIIDIILMIIVITTFLYTFFQIYKKMPFMITNFITYIIPTLAIIIAINLWIPIWVAYIIMIVGILGSYYLTLRKNRKDIENDEKIDKEVQKFSLMTQEEQKEALIKVYEERELIMKKAEIISDKSFNLIISFVIIFGIWRMVSHFFNVNQLILSIIAIFGLLTIFIAYIIDLLFSVKEINKKIKEKKEKQ